MKAFFGEIELIQDTDIVISFGKGVRTMIRGTKTNALVFDNNQQAIIHHSDIEEDIYLSPKCFRVNNVYFCLSKGLDNLDLVKQKIIPPYSETTLKKEHIDTKLPNELMEKIFKQEIKTINLNIQFKE